MLATVEREVFVADPVGRALVGPTWVYWCARPNLFGFSMWGRPSQADVAALIEALRVELRSDVGPHASLVDASRLQSVDASAFALLNGYVRHNAAVLSRQVTRLALVRPEGLAGAVVAGFYQVLERPYPVELFDAAGPALRWLDEGADPALLEAVARRVSEASGVDPVLASVRAAIAERLAYVELRAVARALGMSERTLQRRLSESGTTFQREVTLLRVREAQRLMLDTDDSLTAIALDVGFASLQHFSRSFREATGAQPSAWRAQHRQA